jgi:hypothetical protein
MLPRMSVVVLRSDGMEDRYIDSPKRPPGTRTAPPPRPMDDRPSNVPVSANRFEYRVDPGGLLVVFEDAPESTAYFVDLASYAPGQWVRALRSPGRLRRRDNRTPQSPHEAAPAEL